MEIPLIILCWLFKNLDSLLMNNSRRTILQFFPFHIHLIILLIHIWIFSTVLWIPLENEQPKFTCFFIFTTGHSVVFSTSRTPSKWDKGINSDKLDFIYLLHEIESMYFFFMCICVLLNTYVFLLFLTVKYSKSQKSGQCFIQWWILGSC